MCGISGVITLKEIDSKTAKTALNLFIDMENEGRDACGFYNGKQLIKFPGTPLLLWTLYGLDVAKNPLTFFRGSKMLLFHNRQRTSGSEYENKNNHPFETSRFVYAHNGVITNPIEKEAKIPSEPSTDSWFFLKDIQHRVDDGTEAEEAIKQSIINTMGSLTFWILDKLTQNIYFYNDSYRLSYAIQDNKFWFASLALYLSDIDVKGATAFESNHLFKLTPDLTLTDLGLISHGYRTIYYTKNIYTGNTPACQRTSYDAYEERIPKCSRKREDMRDELKRHGLKVIYESLWDYYLVAEIDEIYTLRIVREYTKILNIGSLLKVPKKSIRKLLDLLGEDYINPKCFW